MRTSFKEGYSATASPELLAAEHVDEEVCGAVDADEEVAEVDDPGHPRRLDAPRRAEHHLVQVGDHLREEEEGASCAGR